MLNLGHIDIDTVYKQCLEKCSSKVISTTQHKCSVSSYLLIISRITFLVVTTESVNCQSRSRA